mmetsp:Transcript_1584/g.5245  ORF Transcript_1584/g.5245 Transcript_1584/m.5245 type:complete len:269 (+) Transcript_1584:1229-2035(+)
MNGSSSVFAGCTSLVATPQSSASVDPEPSFPVAVDVDAATPETDPAEETPLSAGGAYLYSAANACSAAQRFASMLIFPARFAAAARAFPRSPGRKISSVPGAFFASFTRRVTIAARFSNSSCPKSAGSIATTKFPQFFSDILDVTAAPTSGPARSSTISAKFELLYPPSNVLIAPPSMTAFGSSVKLPLPSIATPSGIFFPAVRASSRPKNEYAEVAMSRTTGPVAVGIPTPIGFVPNIGSIAPAGATNSGLTASTSAMSPSFATFSA